jgi:hypothetical protein
VRRRAGPTTSTARHPQSSNAPRTDAGPSHVFSYRSRLLPVRPCIWHAGDMKDLDIQCLRRSALIAQGIEHRFPNTIHTDRPILTETSP